MDHVPMRFREPSRTVLVEVIAPPAVRAPAADDPDGVPVAGDRPPAGETPGLAAVADDRAAAGETPGLAAVAGERAPAGETPGLAAVAGGSAARPGPDPEAEPRA
jgi:hypothetical protein